MAEAIPFEDSYIPEPNSGCWLWLRSVKGKKGTNNYGSIHRNGRSFSAHRYSWMKHLGRIPNGMFVLHKCDVRCCVNPDHLFIGTQSDNIVDCVRKNNMNSYNGNKKSCIHGHEFTTENTYVENRGSYNSRHCKTCDKLRKRNAAKAA